MSIPLHELASQRAMRLAFCYHCQTLTKVEIWDGPPAADPWLQEWINEHMHGMSVDQHPGGRVFLKEASQFDHSGAGDRFEEQAIEEVRAELSKANQEVYDIRDGLRYDAVKCHRKHGQPHFPGKPCIDYQSDSKRVGVQKGSVTKGMFHYVCTFCPYSSSIQSSMS